MHNNPISLALSEAQSVWSTNGRENVALSLGCGTMRRTTGVRDDAFTCCKQSFFGSMSAERQHNRFLSQGLEYIRLDPALDMDDVGLDCFAEIPKLQESFRIALAEDQCFAEMVRNAAFQLMASLFYFEVSEPTWHEHRREYTVFGTIRPRIPSALLGSLRRHDVFGPLYFVVNERRYTFAMPKVITVRVGDLGSKLSVSLASAAYRTSILRQPLSIVALLDIQERFYCRSGTRKRRIATSKG